MILHTKATLDEVLNHRRIPTAGGIARVLRTRFDPLGQLLSLGFGEFAGSPGRGLIHQTCHTLEKVLIAIITNGLLTERKHCSHFADALALSQSQEGMDALDQFERASGVGLLKTTIEVLAGE
jgi:hypothetical protein